MSNCISEIGGTSSAFLVTIGLIMRIIHTLYWEQSILESVFDKVKINQETIKTFKQRISYLGLFQLHERVNLIKD